MKEQEKDQKKPRKPVDWEAVEREYRIGLRSLRDIGAEFGCTEGAIRQKAKQFGWERDLAARIAAKTEALVRKAEVRKSLRTDPVSEREIVEANADRQFKVISKQQERTEKMGEAHDAAVTQLSALLQTPELFTNLGEMMNAPDENGVDKLNELYRKATALPATVDMLKKVIESGKTLIEMQNRVFRIADGPEKPAEDPAKVGAEVGASAAAAALEAFEAKVAAARASKAK